VAPETTSFDEVLVLLTAKPFSLKDALEPCSHWLPDSIAPFGSVKQL